MFVSNKKCWSFPYCWSCSYIQKCTLWVVNFAELTPATFVSICLRRLCFRIILSVYLGVISAVAAGIYIYHLVQCLILISAVAAGLDQCSSESWNQQNSVYRRLQQLWHIYIYIMLQDRDYNPALAYIYISCYRIASVEDYNSALAYIYISCYRISSVEDYNSALAYISCYRIASVDPPENYALKANEKCEALSASLVTIETKMELVFLDTELKQRCTRNRECLGNISSVFIGLRRNLNNIGMRFQWVNGLPLIYSQWVQDNPKGGYMKGCIVWDLQLGRWFDIGCGHLMDVTGLLCEWVIPTSMEISEISLPDPPDKISITRAIKRGIFSIFYVSSGSTEPVSVIMPAHFSFMSNLCSWYINNTGVLQVVEMPLSAELIFSCTTEFFSSVLYSQVCDQTKTVLMIRTSPWNCVTYREHWNVQVCHI